jgi:hypothetical protein
MNKIVYAIYQSCKTAVNIWGIVILKLVVLLGEKKSTSFNIGAEIVSCVSSKGQ